jgi:hypothetical protein
MQMDSSENILLGGQSYLVQTTTGEGFVMLVDKYGEAAFSKTYASGASAGDVINKVAIVSTTYIAVGTSDTGTNAFFLLAIGATGTVSKNLLIATDTSKIANTAILNDLYLQGTEAHIVFDNSVVNIIDTSGTNDDYYIGISGVTGNIIRITGHSTNTLYSIFALKNGQISVYWYDTVTPGNDKSIATDTQATISSTTALQSSDVDVALSPGFCWIAVYVPAGNNYHAFHYTIGGVTTYPTFSGAIIANLPFPPISLSIVYINATSYYLATMLNNQQGSVNLVIGATQSNKKLATGLYGTYFMGATTGAVFVSAGNKVGGESATLANSQAILFKSDLVWNVINYNCYQITAADTTTVAVYAVVAGTLDVIAKTYVTGTSTQTTDTTVPADSVAHVIRAESTQTDTGGSECVLQ